jgi:hypothetical protein
MTTKHTPGPWFVLKSTQYMAIFSGQDEHDDTGRNIVDIAANEKVTPDDKRKAPYWIHDAEDAANARLIAAAPDLLHALRLMLREHDALQMAEGSTDDRWAAATLARAVLNKLGD